MSHQFEVLFKEAQPAASIRTRCAVERLPQVLGVAFGAIAGYLGELGVEPTGAPFVGYFNMDMQDLDIEIGFPVANPIPRKEEIIASEIPAGKQLSYLYKGPYTQMEPVYNAIMEWIAANGHTWTGASYEIYYNSPMDTPENELLTQIVLMLK